MGSSASSNASRQLASSAVALGEERAHKALKRLCQGRIGNVALVLVELARREEPARWHQHLVQFIDDRGFADAGIARDQHQFRRAAPDDAIEGGEQDRDLALPPIKLLGDQQPVRRVVLAQREIVDAALALPVGQATSQVTLETGGALVALVGALGEQLHDDCEISAGTCRPAPTAAPAFSRRGSGPIPWGRTP